MAEEEALFVRLGGMVLCLAQTSCWKQRAQLEAIAQYWVNLTPSLRMARM